MNEKIEKKILEKISQWFEHNGGASKAVIGISGGKDSSVVAALCAKALGPDRVLGVLMPNGIQKDISDSYRLVKHLGIHHIVVDINDAVSSIESSVVSKLQNVGLSVARNVDGVVVSDESRRTQNLPPRIRMATLYAVAQSINGRVVGTGNAAESYVGYCTIYGDLAGDFNPIANLFVDEVVDLGRILGLPKDLIEKTPSDGLCGKTDEENLGFSYREVKEVALKSVGWMTRVSNEATISRIESRHKSSQFKRDIVHVPTIEFYRTSFGDIYDVK